MGQSALMIDLLDERAMIDRIADGAFLRDLSEECGIDKRRLSERLRKHPDYTSAKETAIEVQLDDAQLALRLAKEPADIARAREMFRAAAWRAEREFPERWGGKPVQINNNVNNINVTPDSLSQIEAARRVAFAMAQGAQLATKRLVDKPVDSLCIDAEIVSETPHNIDSADAKS